MKLEKVGNQKNFEIGKSRGGKWKIKKVGKKEI